MKVTAVQIAQLVVSIVALFGTFVLATVAFQTFVRGPTPAKHLNSNMLSSPDTLVDLRNAGNAILTSVRDASGNKLTNLYSPIIWLTNTGDAPIMPSDIFGKIRLKTKDPWTILAINSAGGSGSPALLWRKVGDTEFEADPLLINPHDEILNTVYMTSKVPQTEEFPQFPLDWDMRVANLPQIEYQGLLSANQSRFPQLLNITVGYTGNSVLLVLIIFAAYLAAYVYYLLNIGYLHSPVTAVTFVVLAGTFSIMAADVSETYLTQSLATINQAINAPILLLNFFALWWIAFQIHRKALRSRELAEQGV